MKVEVKPSIRKGISLGDIKPGNGFAHRPLTDDRDAPYRIYIAGQWIGLDDPDWRWVTDMETGEVLRWRTSVVVTEASVSVVAEVIFG